MQTISAKIDRPKGEMTTERGEKPEIDWPKFVPTIVCMRSILTLTLPYSTESAKNKFFSPKKRGTKTRKSAEIASPPFGCHFLVIKTVLPVLVFPFDT